MILKALKKNLLLLVTLFCIACAPPEGVQSNDVHHGAVTESAEQRAGIQKGDASAEAIFLDFSFQGRVLLYQDDLPREDIEQQLLYTIGQLNGDRAVGRLDQVQLEVLKSEAHPEGGIELFYQASLLVAWGDQKNYPERYTFHLPADIRLQGLEDFGAAHQKGCIDPHAHDVDHLSFWYHYRPQREGCVLDPELTTTAEATVTVSEVNSVGRYPEYDLIWEDGVLRVLAIFGRAKDDGPLEWDEGFSSYRNFFHRVRRRLSKSEVLTIEPEILWSPNPDQRSVQILATLKGGQRVRVDLLSIDQVLESGEDFDARYQALSERADLIIYNGHSGLGANIRALAEKGAWLAGQYVVVFMNGCATYSYVDDALFDAHREVNPDDPTGRRYVDVVTNAMPSYFSSMSEASFALFDGLLSFDQPRTYEHIFQGVDPQQVVLVTGEEENRFTPGGPWTAPSAVWPGLDEEMRLRRGESWSLETPILPAGRYQFQLRGSRDADLYLRVGEAPSEEVYDCRPFRVNSRERCALTLNSPAPVHLMVRGWAPFSDVRLTGVTLKDNQR
ncbi:MAG: hypothetical protein VYD19_05130 [Myxococcota bacterium]|nr:hypothetical protein [Myxococcota bacterium]